MVQLCCLSWKLCYRIETQGYQGTTSLGSIIRFQDFGGVDMIPTGSNFSIAPSEERISE
jgi:hypothetical protein